MFASEYQLVFKASNWLSMRLSRSKIKVISVASLLICASRLASAEIGQISPGGINTYALIVSGINKDPNEHLAKDRTVTNLRKFFLSDARLKPEHLSILVADSAVRQGTTTSTADNLRQTLATFAAKIQPTDRFIFYYTGQANSVAGKLRLNLPGEDITHEGLAESINKIKTPSMMIVLDCPGPAWRQKPSRAKAGF